MTIQITIIGLGQIGTSIGLALAEHKDVVRRVGHDREPGRGRQAEKMGALDQVMFNLPSAVRQADLIILAEPADQSRETLELIVPDLKEGAVILDTTPVKTSMADLASKILPPERHFVAIAPTLNPAYLRETLSGIDAAHADLFKDALMVITAPPKAHSEAIKLASDLTSLLGATPFFSDQYEVDGLLAAVHILPQLAAGALLNATTDQPGWREGRKFAGRLFAEITEPINELDDAKQLGQVALNNRDNVVRVIDDMIHSLAEIRTAVAEQDEQALNELLADAQKARALWWQQRQNGKWISEELPKVETPTAKDVFGRLIGIRRRSGSDEKRK